MQSPSTWRSAARRCKLLLEGVWPLGVHSERPELAARSPWERLGLILFVGLLVATCPYVLHRTITDAGSDFPEYYQAGRYVLEHGARQPNTMLAYYWPSIDVAWVALAWLPLPAAACVWYAIGCLSWFGLLAATRRYLLVDLGETQNHQLTLATGLLVLPIALNHLCLGAFHMLMLWWLVSGLGRVSRGRCWSGGVLLGLAVWIKLLPILGVGYLLLKRKWKPAAVAVACALVIDVVLSVAAFGPRAAWEAHRKWWLNDSLGTTNKILTSPAWYPEHRCKNQALTAVMRRTLTDFASDPDRPLSRVDLAAFSTSQVKALYLAVMGLLLAGMAWVCRQPGQKLSGGQWSTEIALIVLATMWFSPVMWTYYATALAPPMAVVLSRTSRYPRLRWLVVALWLAAMAMLGWQLARGLGELLWMTYFLGAVLVWTSRRQTSTAI